MKTQDPEEQIGDLELAAIGTIGVVCVVGILMICIVGILAFEFIQWAVCLLFPTQKQT